MAKKQRQVKIPPEGMELSDHFIEWLKLNEPDMYNELPPDLRRGRALFEYWAKMMGDKSKHG